MVVMVQDKIVTDAPVTDAVAKKFFEDNKDKFKHGERISFEPDNHRRP